MATSAPPETTTTRSTIASTISSEWVVMTSATGGGRHFSVSRKVARDTSSNPASGSSTRRRNGRVCWARSTMAASKTMAGVATSATARLSLRRAPPESKRTVMSRSANERYTARAAASHSGPTWPSVAPRRRAINERCSRPVSWGVNGSPCGHSPMTGPAALPRMQGHHVTKPEEGTIVPAITASRVDLPEPFGPTTANRSPCETRNHTGSKAFVTPR